MRWHGEPSPSIGEAGNPDDRLAVITPCEAPMLTPAAARVLLRIVLTAAGREVAP
jgi:hypothetical protein